MKFKVWSKLNNVWLDGETDIYALFFSDGNYYAHNIPAKEAKELYHVEVCIEEYTDIDGEDLYSSYIIKGQVNTKGGLVDIEGEIKHDVVTGVILDTPDEFYYLGDVRNIEVIGYAHDTGKMR
jgi:hypothetical protein